MIITVAHTKGGVGKSTLAWHLAHSFTPKARVIDLDFQQTLFFINTIGGNTLSVEQPQNVDELLGAIASVGEDEICIIDLGGFDSDMNRTAIEHSDKVLIPISESITEVLGFKTFEGVLEQLNMKARLHVVLNNVHPLTQNFQIIKDAIAQSEITMLETIVRSRKIYKTSMGRGSSIFSTKWPHIAKDEIEGVRDELIRD
ncbi:MAG: ParA family protein [Campylobacterales bacterium]|nr:ParA family protein [Campylobacterales bacterium]